MTFRHRRFNIRRVLEFAEMKKNGTPNVLYRWDVKSDSVKGVNKMESLVKTLSLYSGMGAKEIESDVNEKIDVLNWMVKKRYFGVDEVGEIVSRYYMNTEDVLEAVKKDANWRFSKV